MCASLQILTSSHRFHCYSPESSYHHLWPTFYLTGVTLYPPFINSQKSSQSNTVKMYVRSHCGCHQNPSQLQIPHKAKCSLHTRSQDYPTGPCSTSLTSPPLAPLLSPCSRYTGLLAILTYTRHIPGSSSSNPLRTLGITFE